MRELENAVRGAQVEDLGIVSRGQPIQHLAELRVGRILERLQDVGVPRYAPAILGRPRSSAIQAERIDDVGIRRLDPFQDHLVEPVVPEVVEVFGAVADPEAESRQLGSPGVGALRFRVRLLVALPGDVEGIEVRVGPAREVLQDAMKHWTGWCCPAPEVGARRGARSQADAPSVGRCQREAS
jgi:hypothetical protein